MTSNCERRPETNSAALRDPQPATNRHAHRPARLSSPQADQSRGTVRQAHRPEQSRGTGSRPDSAELVAGRGKSRGSPRQARGLSLSKAAASGPERSRGARAVFGRISPGPPHSQPKDFRIGVHYAEDGLLSPDSWRWAGTILEERLAQVNSCVPVWRWNPLLN